MTDYTPPTEQLLDRMEPTESQLITFCDLYRELHLRGWTHDQACERLRHLVLWRLGSRDQPDPETVQKWADNLIPTGPVGYDHTREAQIGRHLTAVAMVEAMLDGDRDAATALTPPAPPEIRALIAAQTGVTVNVLGALIAGHEQEVLDQIRTHLLASIEPQEDSE